MSKQLDGQDEIATYMRSSWNRIMKLIERAGFPAKKIEGRWMSDTETIEKWRQGLLQKNDVNL